jgi:hypothetical protein
VPASSWFIRLTFITIDYHNAGHRAYSFLLSLADVEAVSEFGADFGPGAVITESFQMLNILPWLKTRIFIPRFGAAW